MGWSLKQEVRYGTDVGGLPDIITELAHGHRYDTVFSDVLDYCYHSFHFPVGVFTGEKVDMEKPLDEITGRYRKKARPLFEQYNVELHRLYQQYTGLHSGHHGEKTIGDHFGWYDPWGSLYEAISSKWKASAMGQFFTPSHVCDMMARINMGRHDKPVVTINDPCAGSGRMLLSSATECYRNGQACYISAQDIDPMCAKMTAVNMAGNGVVGEVTKMDSLRGPQDYDWSVKIVPALEVFPPDDIMSRLLARMVLSAQFGSVGTKMHLMLDVPNESTFVYHMYASMEEDAKAERIEQVKQAMAGTLFAEDDKLAEMTVLSEMATKSVAKRKNGRPKPKRAAAPKGEQKSLF